MLIPLPETIGVTIPTNGFEDTYNDFEHIYPAELRNRLAELALGAARTTAPDIVEDKIWVSGFSGDYSEAGFEAADTVKLERASAANRFGDESEDIEIEFGFEGDDSNQRNIVERDIHAIRAEKLAITRRLNELGSQGRLTPSVRDAARAELQNLDNKIKNLKSTQTDSTLPVYYATSLESLRDDNNEDNPLAYIGDVPGTGYLALYDGRAITNDPTLGVSPKSDTQIRIAGRGLAIMRHVLAVVRLDFVE